MAILREKWAVLRERERERERNEELWGLFATKSHTRRGTGRPIPPSGRSILHESQEKNLSTREPGDRLKIRSSVSQTDRSVYDPVDCQRRCNLL